MKLLTLRTHSFRNLEDATIQLPPQLTVLRGRNGQGKTNVLEAIYSLGNLKSFRDAGRRELIRIGKTEALLEGEVLREGISKTLRLELRPGGRTLSVNGHRVKDLSEYHSQIRVVCFSPEDMELFGGEPALRRRLLDRLVFQVRPHHAVLVRDFQKILEHRNALLRDGVRNAERREQRAVWTERLVGAAALVADGRRAFLEALNRSLPDTYLQVSSVAEAGILEGTPNLKHQLRGLEDGKPPTRVDEFVDLYREQAEKKEDEEWQRGFTLWGPHKDDFVPCYGQRASRDFASTGQKKTFLLALRLTELFLVEDSLGEPPILLLDDLTAELDDERLATLFSLIERRAALSTMQIVLTTAAADLGEFLSRKVAQPTQFLVEAGRLQPEFSRSPALAPRHG